MKDVCEYCSSKIKGFTDYIITNEGDVISTKYILPRVLKPAITKAGYYQVILCKNGERHNKSIHRLVAETFIQNIEEYPEVNHKDGNKLNNHVLNLEWCTSSQNQKHAFEEGLQIPLKGEELHNSKLTESDVKEIRMEYESNITYRELGEKYGVAQETIRDVVKYVTWKHLKPDPEPLIVKSGNTWVAYENGVNYLYTDENIWTGKDSYPYLHKSNKKTNIIFPGWKSFTGPDPDITELTDEIALFRPMVFVGMENNIYGQLYGIVKDENFPALIVLPDGTTSTYRNGRLATAQELREYTG